MTNPSDPAFGQHGFDLPGLTKREYFAAMAMQGYLSNGPAHERGFTVDGKDMPVVEASVYIADALIAELSKEVKA